ncbi:glycosyltransferase [Zhengella mangrovi]|uniref:glycosyltransferase n=1 Tax=Zhengella mangrovi TaxID=1982044 RepID=UPI000E09C96A|nr:glycosyltransferase [Zhengella mangrovi]
MKKISIKNMSIKKISNFNSFRRNYIRLMGLTKNFGYYGAIRIIFYRYFIIYFKSLLQTRNINYINGVLQKNKQRPTIIVVSTLDWDYPFRQRVHHLAEAFVQQGAAVIFISPMHGYDGVLAKEVSPHLVISPHRRILIKMIPHDILLVLSTDGSLNRSEITTTPSSGRVVCYDFIDHPDDSLNSVEYDIDRWKLHYDLINGELSACVICSAEKILESIHQSKRVVYSKLVTNGVDVRHFSEVIKDLSSLNKSFRSVVEKNKPIIGYFGALAAWFDYRLVIDVARAMPDAEFVIFGVRMDSTADLNWNWPENVHILPPLHYDMLPIHSAWFDVAIIPFVINDITLSTSPLKLFEYLAQGHPVVSTPLPECQKCSLVFCASNALAFEDAIRKAILLKRDDEDYERRAKAYARENSWAAKARQIMAVTRPATELSSSGD